MELGPPNPESLRFSALVPGFNMAKPRLRDYAKGLAGMLVWRNVCR